MPAKEESASAMWCNRRLHLKRLVVREHRGKVRTASSAAISAPASASEAAANAAWVGANTVRVEVGSLAAVRYDEPCRQSAHVKSSHFTKDLHLRHWSHKACRSSRGLGDCTEQLISLS